MELFNHAQASRLLRDKFVLVLGDSIQRSVYKDIVLLLQKDEFLSLEQLKSKGELSFEGDSLVDGGKLGHMHNGTAYREVREYRSARHHVRFYFLTRIYSPYVHWILNVVLRRERVKPHVVIVNSCLWDISRYNNINNDWLQEYTHNLNLFFRGLKAVLPQQSLVMWTLTMPVSQTIKAGFLPPQMVYHRPYQRPLEQEVCTANQFSWHLAMWNYVDVLDLYTRFAHRPWQRMGDGVHWDHLAHRTITTLILERAAKAWGGNEDDFTSDDFFTDNFPPFGGIDHAEPEELASPPVASPPSLPSLESTAGTDGVAEGTADSLKPASTSTLVVSGGCTATKTEQITEKGPERTELEKNGMLKTVPVNEPRKPEQKPSGGNGAHNAEPIKPKLKLKPACGQKAEHSGSHHPYDCEGFTEDSVTTAHHFIPGYWSFDGDEPPPPHTHPHRRQGPPAHSTPAMHAFRYSPYWQPPHSIASASQRGGGWNNTRRNNSYVIRYRKTKRLH